MYIKQQFITYNLSVNGVESFAIYVAPFIALRHSCQCNMRAVHKSNNSWHVMQLIESKQKTKILFCTLNCIVKHLTVQPFVVFLAE